MVLISLCPEMPSFDHEDSVEIRREAYTRSLCSQTQSGAARGAAWLVEGEVLEGVRLLEGELLGGDLMEGKVLQGELLGGELLEGEMLKGELLEVYEVPLEIPRHQMSACQIQKYTVLFICVVQCVGKGCK